MKTFRFFAFLLVVSFCLAQLGFADNTVYTMPKLSMPKAYSITNCYIISVSGHAKNKMPNNPDHGNAYVHVIDSQAALDALKNEQKDRPGIPLVGAHVVVTGKNGLWSYAGKSTDSYGRLILPIKAGTASPGDSVRVLKDDAKGNLEYYDKTFTLPPLSDWNKSNDNRIELHFCLKKK